jgi:hypothetical protein
LSASCHNQFFAIRFNSIAYDFFHYGRMFMHLAQTDERP